MESSMKITLYTTYIVVLYVKVYDGIIENHFFIWESHYLWDIDD